MNPVEICLENLFIVKEVKLLFEESEKQSGECIKEGNNEDVLQVILPPNSNLILKSEYNKMIEKIKEEKIKLSKILEQKESENKKEDRVSLTGKKKFDQTGINKNPQIPVLNHVVKKPKITSHQQVIPAAAKNLSPEMKVFISWKESRLEEELYKIKTQIEAFTKKDEEDAKKYNKGSKTMKEKTKKWLTIAQDAINKIVEMIPIIQGGENNSIKKVVDGMSLDKDLLNYDSEEEDFKC
jgi:hypothetical protein